MFQRARAACQDFRAREEICCNILRMALISGAWASPLLSGSHKTH